ncbi:hypothetical protein V8D89_009819 [Ganoderma adspersum]
MEEDEDGKRPVMLLFGLLQLRVGIPFGDASASASNVTRGVAADDMDVLDRAAHLPRRVGSRSWRGPTQTDARAERASLQGVFAKGARLAVDAMAYESVVEKAMHTPCVRERACLCVTRWKLHAVTLEETIIRNAGSRKAKLDGLGDECHHVDYEFRQTQPELHKAQTARCRLLRGDLGGQYPRVLGTPAEARASLEPGVTTSRSRRRGEY